MDIDNSGPSSCSCVNLVTRRYLFDKINEQNLPSINDKLEYLENYLLVCCGDSDEDKKCMKHRFSHFKTEIKKGWSKAHGILEKILTNNDEWLANFRDPYKKTFSECSERTKRRKTEEIRSSVSEEVIVHAAQVVLQKEGKRNASQVLKNITNSPASANECKKDIQHQKSKIPLLLGRYCKCAWKLICLKGNTKWYELPKKFYPCYELVIKAKEECYPPQETLRVTATRAESDIQSLLDHTVKRLSIFLEEVLMTLTEIERNSLQIICKWGCDGSQQTQYNQKEKLLQQQKNTEIQQRFREEVGLLVDMPKCNFGITNDDE